MYFRVRPVAGTTRRGYDLANILQDRVRDGSPEIRVRVVAGTILQGYDSSNFPQELGVCRESNEINGEYNCSVFDR